MDHYKMDYYGHQARSLVIVFVGVAWLHLFMLPSLKY